jgi:CubicO group peptidase (beta-lactamase class C family)
MAMPEGESTAVLEIGGGYLPSLAHVTSDGPAAAMASDSASLARWWRAFCAGEIVSEASLTEMSTFHDGYGLGPYNPGDPYAQVVGHTGEHDGYVAWAGCLPEDGSVIVVLSKSRGRHRRDGPPSGRRRAFGLTRTISRRAAFRWQLRVYVP